MTVQKEGGGLNKIYFPNLNGIRFFAAFLVIIHHVEQLKSFFGLQNIWGKSSFISIIGPLGVKLFFVLSGFLITFLLLAEEKKTSTISIKKFYVRRILRIWPLYFLIISLSLFVLPNFGFFTWPGFEKEIVSQNMMPKTVLFFTFFANLALVFFGTIPYASQTWSIGTEEQFYLIWPIILKKIKKYRIFIMLSIILGYYLISALLKMPFSNFIPYKNIFKAFWDGFTIDCMAIGGFFAVILFTDSKYLKYFLNRWFFYVALCTVTICVILGYNFPIFDSQIYCVLFGIIILNFAANRNIKISLENKYFNYLGQISYGLYMYHPISILLIIKLGMSIGITSNFIIYPLSLILTICISSFSYEYFEVWFLKLKSRFSNVQSSDKSN
jgi:peptidoglycan/LPS O-acetylase OafA/YrhL